MQKDGIRETLLNPHGSDETIYIHKDLVDVENFLTHTVQMKLKINDLNYDLICFLLNPHGSDETTL